ncbi:helix-turn-helix transcriptional regulator [Actinoplanes sp. ATCC 53533]|uniref:LuxR C-terminal-related transcriptional regulator n=1 Tax=Actinoplanes sp. ATCC 53533 TaxID=1288362 RepID=UPI000F781288|nr:LuxR C-terminal-related transcriptional regulator [Actinoplanes sp. ATCC 53533]RSM69579.1 helix-turn-helix transcriptional regulator [Actinoplanes sp. ATCC 53533]
MRAELALPTPVRKLRPEIDPLLPSRFEIPEQPRFLVARPRLLEAMPDRDDTPVTLVVGPAGSGKTQLVASWAHDQGPDAAVAWITLEHDDDRSSAFWTYVVAALRHAGIAVSPSPAVRPGPDAVDRSFLVRLAAELAAQPVPLLLVLDGASVTGGECWATELEFVLRHAGPMLKLILIGRWDPPLPLHRYRLAGRLAEIRTGDLAFTVAEAEELLTLHGVELSPAGLATLLEHTEGWAAGLRLFAMALQDQRDADRLVGTITGKDAGVAAYLVDEVLRVQPPHVRTFLLETSILDTFTPELAEAVTGRGDARRLLVHLHRHNAFVQPVAEYAAAYRFHRLFAELLRAQLLCENPQRTAALHSHAARWLADRGQTVDAIGHAIEAQDWSTAATIAVDHYAVGQLVIEGRHGRLGAILAQLPEDCDSAEAAIVSAALALADASDDRCALQLARAQDLVIRRDWEYSQALALADSILGVLLAAARADHAEVLQLSPATEQALAQTPSEVTAAHPELRALTMAARGIAHSYAGAVDAAASCLTEVVGAAAPGYEDLTISCRQHLALIEAHRGRLRHAERLATEATDDADRCGVAPARLARVVLAWVALERDDTETAANHLRTTDPRRHGWDDAFAAAASTLVQARQMWIRGDLRGAIRLIEQARATVGGTLPAWLMRELSVSHGRLLIGAGRPGEALATVGEYERPHPPDVAVLHAEALAAGGEPERAAEILTPVLADAGLPPAVCVAAWLARARIAEQLGEADEARTALRHASRAATALGRRRDVALARGRLSGIAGDDLGTQHRAWADETPAAGRRADQTPALHELVIVEALSPREMEVLRSMAALLPTEEIAATLYVSVNTVKTHVRSILRKLSAARRNEAVRRARSLGLIPDVTHLG